MIDAQESYHTHNDLKIAWNRLLELGSETPPGFFDTLLPRIQLSLKIILGRDHNWLDTIKEVLGYDSRVFNGNKPEGYRSDWTWYEIIELLEEKLQDYGESFRPEIHQFFDMMKPFANKNSLRIQASNEKKSMPGAGSLDLTIPIQKEVLKFVESITNSADFLEFLKKEMETKWYQKRSNPSLVSSLMNFTKLHNTEFHAGVARSLGLCQEMPGYLLKKYEESEQDFSFRMIPIEGFMRGRHNASIIIPNDENLHTQLVQVDQEMKLLSAGDTSRYNLCEVISENSINSENGYDLSKVWVLDLTVFQFLELDHEDQSNQALCHGFIDYENRLTLMKNLCPKYIGSDGVFFGPAIEYIRIANILGIPEPTFSIIENE